MCGITGYIGSKDAFYYILNGLKMLENRGYDSAGICTIDAEHNYVLNKFATTSELSSLKKLESYEKHYKNSCIGIGHTRWATHGAKTDANSHPHTDNTGIFSLVHNGIIENYFELKKELEQEHNITFVSETDTEVIVNLISIYYKKYKHVEESIVEATGRLKGTWGIVVLCSDKPDNLYCARHGSPLLIGFGGSFMLVASEQSGFCNYLTNYVCLEDGDVVVLKKRKGKITFEKQDAYVLKDITVKDIQPTPDPYPHWTIKEINEQYEASIRAISMGGRLLDDYSVKLGGLMSDKDSLIKLDHLILLGCGTSLYAGLHSLKFFKELCDFVTVQAFDGAEFDENDIPKQGNTGLLFLSQSGETRDLHRCIKIGRSKGLFMIGVVNVIDSQIARDVDCGCYLNAGREVGVASTKCFTSQVIVLSMIAIWFAQIKDINNYQRKKYIKNLRQLPMHIKKTIKNTEEHIKKLAEVLMKHDSIFILGKGSSKSIAQEGSLKIKEIGYIHAEGYGGNSLRHGPYALIKKDTPIIFVAPNDSHITHMKNTIEEVHSREAMPICITDCKDEMKHSRETIVVEANTTYKGILHVIPMQLLSYYISVLKGHNGDKPKNLSKTVSV